MQKVYSQILAIAGDVITVEAQGVGYKELAQVRTSSGISLAQVIRLDGNKVSLQVLAGSRGISTDDEVRFLKTPMRVSFSENLVGRIFNGAGLPRDAGPALTENMINIGTPSVNPARRIVPNRMIHTGIPMIDVFNSLVESQKLPIFSVAGEPYNELFYVLGWHRRFDLMPALVVLPRYIVTDNVEVEVALGVRV